MSQFFVKPDQIDQCSEKLMRVSNDMEEFSQVLDNINVDSFLRGSSAGKIDNYLKKVSDNLEQQKKNAAGFSDALLKISSYYKTTENQVSGIPVFSGNSAKNTGTGSLGASVDKNKVSPGSPGGAPSSNGSNQKEKGESNSVSYIQGSVGASTAVFGINAGVGASGDIGGASWDHKFSSGIKKKDGKIDSVSLFNASISGEAHIASGKVKGNIGALSGDLGVNVGQVKAEGSAGITLYKNGELAPQISLKGEVKGAVVTGKINAALGTDNTDIHGSANGSLVTGSLKGDLGIGKVTYKDDEGNIKTGYGVSAEVKAEGYLAEGTAKGGFSILGIKVDIGISGKAGGAGGSVGWHAVKGSVGGSVSAGVGLGIGLDFNIDWTNFKWGW